MFEVKKKLIYSCMTCASVNMWVCSAAAQARHRGSSARNFRTKNKEENLSVCDWWEIGEYIIETFITELSLLRQRLRNEIKFSQTTVSSFLTIEEWMCKSVDVTKWYSINKWMSDLITNYEKWRGFEVKTHIEIQSQCSYLFTSK